MYAREVQGTVHSFGVSGKLIMNGLVMYDRETGTLWSQVLGEAVKGPLAGVKLRALPATQTTWAQWRSAHPETLVLDKGGGYRGDRYASYFAGSKKGVLGSTRNDKRLPPKELVIGIQGASSAKAYPFRTLAREGVTNDTFEGRPLLIVFDDETDAGLVFDRSVDGRVLTFGPSERLSGQPMVADHETGTRWNAVTGRAIDGPLQGSRLEQVPATYAFWFGWSDYYPKTELYAGVEE